MDADFGLVRHPCTCTMSYYITLRIGWSYYLSLKRDVIICSVDVEYKCASFFFPLFSHQLNQGLQRTGRVHKYRCMTLYRDAHSTHPCNNECRIRTNDGQMSSSNRLANHNRSVDTYFLCRRHITHLITSCRELCGAGLYLSPLSPPTYDRLEAKG